VKKYDAIPPPRKDHPCRLAAVRPRRARTALFDVSEFDFLIFPQGRRRRSMLGMQEAGFAEVEDAPRAEKWGYTGSAASVALDEALPQKKITPGDMVVMVGSGVGNNQAGAAFSRPDDERFGDRSYGGAGSPPAREGRRGGEPDPR